MAMNSTRGVSLEGLEELLCPEELGASNGSLRRTVPSLTLGALRI